LKTKNVKLLYAVIETAKEKRINLIMIIAIDGPSGKRQVNDAQTGSKNWGFYT